MELHPDVEQLFRQAESALKVAVGKRGRCDPFALLLRTNGAIETVSPQNESNDNPVGALLMLLVPLVAGDASIKASAMCTTMDANGRHAAIIDLEHKEAFRALAIIEYKKTAFLGWSFSAAKFKKDTPKLFATPPPPQIDIQHPDFHLRLGSGWKQIQSKDIEQFSFESKERGSGVVISVLKTKVPKDKLVDTALAFADVRQKAEISADPARKIVIGDKTIDLKDNGAVGHVAYAGYDDRGNIFRFMGWVTQTKVLSLWVTTTTRDNNFSKSVFEEVLKGFRFSIP